MVVSAVRTPYLHQQKMYACNNVKDISTWDTIALQWKQHFYHKLNLKLSDKEQKRVDWINYRVHKVFERRYSNPEEVQTYSPPEQVDELYQDTPSIAIIDIMGACYDGNTLNRRGLGGSEAAVIQIARELSDVGFDVTVYNACDEGDCKPGVYDFVKYLPLSALDKMPVYDVVISSRVATPFVPNEWNVEQSTVRKIPTECIKNINRAKLKVLWMHDTFSPSDQIIERLLTEQHVNELWTLSDFHYNYLTNNTHGSTYSEMRNYEVLRNHTWITRNGMKLPELTRDLDSKEQHHFVFNSNRSKGLHPLLHDVWPQVKKRIPGAKLTIIGGYYKLDKAVVNDDEYEDFMKMVGDTVNDDSITFTGILSLEQIYDIYAKASYLLYPTEHPETFGISTLEAQYHNMQVITHKFGALEELAYPSDSMIDYSCTPNALKGNINRFEQAEKLADLALERVVQGDRKFHKAKFEQIREIAGWDTVALEWKQHIYSKLGFYLSASEAQKALYTKSQWQKIFGRRVTTPEQWVAPFTDKQKKIVVISPFYNAGDFIERCIHSVAAQIYDNYEHIIIDDCSTDNSNVALNTISDLPESIRHKFKLIKNPKNQGAVYNHIQTIREQDPETIVILLDGDDWLENRPDIFQYYNHIHDNHDFTYGSCWSVVDNIPLVSQPYPSQVKANKSYRSHLFNWYAPYTHLRTFKTKLIKYESDSVFTDSNGNWFKAGGDLATFYKALENCDSDRVYCSSDIVYKYNDAHPNNDYKINGDEQTKTAKSIVGREVPKVKKKILIAIPCKNDIEADTFKSIYDLEVPEGYETDFQYFYGYAVDQVRNLIANWVVNAYDYLFAVDHDMIFEKDTLKKLLAHDKPLVSGVYRQRNEIQMLELYDAYHVRLDAAQLTGGLQEIGGCGFGCVLVKKEVFTSVPYPWFVYHQALNHNHTFSEDIDFCKKAVEKGFKLYTDGSILCKHIGQRVFEVELPKVQEDPVKVRLRNLSNVDMLPQEHQLYLSTMKRGQTEQPQVIYDIGACVLHWTNAAKKVWPNAKYFAFEAMNETEFLYQETGMGYVSGALLYKEDNVDIDFYENMEYPGGNSIYRENPELNPAAAVLYTENHKVVKKGMRLDTLIKMFNFPSPDMIKIDVQGAELDVLLGATETLQSCQDIILELQSEEYNIGSPKLDEVKTYLESIGFKLVTHDPFSSTKYDGDYHFSRNHHQ
jgi:FkbM family methyltransferase